MIQRQHSRPLPLPLPPPPSSQHDQPLSVSPTPQRLQGSSSSTSSSSSTASPFLLQRNRSVGASTSSSAFVITRRPFPYSFACLLREVFLCMIVLWLRWVLLRFWDSSSSSSSSSSSTTATTSSSTILNRWIIPHEVNITLSSGGGANNNNKNQSTLMFIQSLAPRACRSNAIVFMAQKKHSTYGRDSFGLLFQALDLLYDNYLQQDPSFVDNVDVFIFHTGDMLVNPDLEVLEYRLNKKQEARTRGLVHLVDLRNTPYWQLPPWHKHDNQARDWAVHDLFPIGYRHMCRWFGIQIWNFFEQLNRQQHCQYRYILRLDEDSFIHSPIAYDVFDFMKQRQYAYGYRLCAYELDYNKLVFNWFAKWHNRTKPLRAIDWGLCGFYNNFFVADLEFFTSRKVKSFLREVDRMGFIYRKRYGDLIIHTMAVYAFAKTEQIHRFLDFTYQHVTVDHVLTPEKGCVVWGGIQAGYNDPHASRTLDEYYRKRVTSRGCTANVSTMAAADLSPTYSHLPDQLKEKLALKTIVAGKVEIPNKGVLSG